MNFTFGLDPEFVLTQNNTYVSAIDVIGSPKHDCVIIEEYTYYYDNLLAECTIPHASSKEELIKNIKKGLKYFKNIVDPCKLLLQSTTEFPQSAMKHKDAFKIGCKPEYCAYTLEQITPEEYRNNIRISGGHIHLGFEYAQINQGCLFATRMLDLFLGVPSVILDLDNTSKNRRKLYGQAGRFRPASYGVEYRTLGNFWLASPKLVLLVYDICEWTTEFLTNNGYNIFWDFNEDQIDWNDENFDITTIHKSKIYDPSQLQKCINNCDKKQALFFMKIINKYLPKSILNDIDQLTDVKFDFYKEWE